LLHNTELLRFGADGFIGDEPGVAAAAQVLGVVAAGDVGFVLERHADRQAVELVGTGGGEVKNMLVVAVEEAFAGHWFEVAAAVLLEGDRFHPGDVVLQREQRAQSHDQFERQPRRGRRAGDVEKQRAVGTECTFEFGRDRDHPVEVRGFRQSVLIGAVGNFEIVRRRGDDEIDRSRRDLRQELKAIAAMNCVAHLLRHSFLN